MANRAGFLRLSSWRTHQMEPIIDAAERGGTATMGLALAMCICAIGIGIAWINRTRDRIDRDRRDFELREREVLEKRLAAGADAMAELKSRASKLEEANVQVCTGLIPRIRELDRYVEKHEQEHEKIDKTLQGVRDSVADLRIDVASMGERLAGSISTVSQALSRLIDVRNPGGES